MCVPHVLIARETQTINIYIDVYTNKPHIMMTAQKRAEYRHATDGPPFHSPVSLPGLRSRRPRKIASFSRDDTDSAKLKHARPGWRGLRTALQGLWPSRSKRWAASTRKTLRDARTDTEPNRRWPQLYRGEVKDAMGLLERVIKAQPKNVDAIDLYARAATDAGNHELALKALKKAIGLAPKVAHRWMDLAQIQSGATALKCYRQGIVLMQEEAGRLGANEM